MHSEPCRKRDGAVKFMAMLTDFSDGCVAPDHRHDALVEVLKGLPGLAGYIRLDVPCAPFAGLFGDGRKLWQRLPVFPRDVREISQTIDSVEALHREVGSNIDTATVPRLQTQIG